MPGGIDRGSNDFHRLQRNMQRLRGGGATSTMLVNTPLTNVAGKLGLALAATGGLQVSAGTLGIKLNTNPALSLATGGLSVLVDSAGAILRGAAGISASVDGTTLAIATNAIGIKALGVGSGQIAAGAVGLSKLGALTTKGDILGFDSAHNRVPIGSNGQVLTADSTAALGLKWAAPLSLTTKGDLQTFDTGNQRLAVGTDRQLLFADSSTATGLRWSTNTWSVSSDVVSPTDGEQWYNSTTGSHKERRTGVTVSRMGLINSSGNGAAISNTITRTSFGLGVAIAANFLTVGRTVRFRFGGNYASTGSPSLLVAGNFNGLGGTVGDGVSVTAAATGRFIFELTMFVVSAGAGGTANITGSITIDTSTGSMTTALGATGAALNTTISNTIDANAQWGVANAGNTINVRVFSIEMLN